MWDSIETAWDNDVVHPVEHAANDAAKWTVHAGKSAYYWAMSHPKTIYDVGVQGVSLAASAVLGPEAGIGVEAVGDIAGDFIFSGDDHQTNSDVGDGPANRRADPTHSAPSYGTSSASNRAGNINPAASFSGSTN